MDNMHVTSSSHEGELHTTPCIRCMFPPSHMEMDPTHMRGQKHASDVLNFSFIYTCNMTSLLGMTIGRAWGRFLYAQTCPTGPPSKLKPVPFNKRIF